jgi:iron complex outermembrane recepter protein
MKIRLAGPRSLAIGAAQWVFLLACAPIGPAQSANSENPASQQPASDPGQTAAPQTAPGGAPNASDGGLEPVIVTGYLIPRVGEGPQPVATLNQDFIQKQAYQTINDILNNYPGGLSAQNTQTFAGNSNSPGSSAYSLKGLPPGATLVLIDGYRFPGYSIAINAGTVPFVDINSIPLAAVDRIEILKDGGGATYGDDAEAGVINIITKDDYKGADIINYFGESQRGDDQIYHLAMTGGISQKGDFGKVSIVATFDYFDQSPIDSKDRAFSNNSEFSRLSPNYINESTVFFPPNGSYFGLTTGNVYIQNPASNHADLSLNGTPSETTNPLDEQLYPREKRYGGTVNVTYNPWDWFKLYDHFIIQRNEETSVTPNQGFSFGDSYPPNQASFGTPKIVIPARNPFNPTGENLIPLIGQALPEFGPWETTTIGRTFRNLTGATIFLPWNNWYINIAAVYGESDVSELVEDSVKTRELQEALNGQLPQLPGVFFNPFTNDLGHPNAIFYPYLKTSQYEDNRSDLVQYVLKAGGTVWALPSGDLTAASGMEYRGESYIQSSDLNSRNFNITSADFPGQLFSARRWVQSLYGELSIPIFGDRWSWPGLRDLEVILDERLDNYSQFGSSAKPKIAVLYKPLDDIAIRLTYSEGFTVPSLGQLFTVQSPFSTTVFDPIKGVNANVLFIQGGNPSLKPENTYGYYGEIVWTPGSKNEDSWWHWAKGFTAYLDWYQVEIHNLIAILPAPLLLASNLSRFEIRAPNGTLIEILDNFGNLGTLLTDGIEFGASYVSKEYNWGKLELDVNGAYVYNYSESKLLFEPGGFSQLLVIDESDTTGGPGPPGPDFKLVASIFYSKHVFGNDLFRTGFTLNYESAELDEINDGHGTIPAVDAGLTAPGYIHLIGDWTTVDWQISYEFGPPVEVTPETPKPGYNKEGGRIAGEKAIAPAPEGHGWSWRRLLDNTTFTFGIKNLADTRPPLAIDGNGGYQGYDTLATNPVQRFFYASIEKKF